MIAIGGCHSSEQASQPVTESQTQTAKVVKPLPCHAMPPIRDTTKLKQNLIKNGYITADMTPEQADAKVAEYIQMRQEAFKRCGKDIKGKS